MEAECLLIEEASGNVILGNETDIERLFGSDEPLQDSFGDGDLAAI